MIVFFTPSFYYLYSNKMSSLGIVPTVSQLTFVAHSMGLERYEKYIEFRIQGHVIEKHNYLLSDIKLDELKRLIIQCVTKRDMAHYRNLEKSPLARSVLELLKADVIESNSFV